MSSFELLELFGVEIIEPKGELRSVRVHGDPPGYLRVQRIFPDDAYRTIRVDFAPEDGELARVLRGGERPGWQEMLRQTANETAILRASQVEGDKSDEIGTRLFYPIAREREFAVESEQRRAEEIRFRSEDSGDFGMASMWTLEEVN